MRRTAAPLLSAGTALGLLLAAVPALAQQPDTEALAGMERQVATPPDPCALHGNLVQVMIDPDVHSIPFWVRPFTTQDETEPELLALWRRCQEEPGSHRALVQWDGDGPGLEPLGDLGDAVVGAPPDRPDLRDPDYQPGAFPNLPAAREELDPGILEPDRGPGVGFEDEEAPLDGPVVTPPE